MKWNSISTNDEAIFLLKHFGYFHDSCTRESHMWTGHSVNDRLAMTVCSNLDTSIKFLIQRQLKDPSCIELLFKGVTRINIVPSPENYDSIIYESNLGKINDEYFWVIDTLQTPSDLTSTEDSWITAKKLSWRATDEFMDDDLRYGGQT